MCQAVQVGVICEVADNSPSFWQWTLWTGRVNPMSIVTLCFQGRGSSVVTKCGFMFGWVLWSYAKIVAAGRVFGAWIMYGGYLQVYQFTAPTLELVRREAGEVRKRNNKCSLVRALSPVCISSNFLHRCVDTKLKLSQYWLNTFSCWS